MADRDSKRYYWLKLEKDFFKRHDIRIIEGMPNGKDYIIFYLKLLCESTSHEGYLRFSETIPYNESMLSTITNTNIDIVRSAIKIFTELQMMQLLDDGTYYFKQVEKMIGSETGSTQRKRELKERINLNVEAKELPLSYPYRLGNSMVYSNEKIVDSTGKEHYVDEKRYGGNGKIKLAETDGVCELCGSREKVVIHHKNGYSNDKEDLQVLCSKCHGLEHSGKRGGNIPLDIEKEKDIELDIEIDKEKEIFKEKEQMETLKDLIDAVNLNIYNKQISNTDIEILKNIVDKGYSYESIYRDLENYKNKGIKQPIAYYDKAFKNATIQEKVYQPPQEEEESTGSAWLDNFNKKWRK